MARKSRWACDASLDCLEAESMPCLSLLRRVQRSRQSMIRGLMIRRSHFSLCLSSLRRVQRPRQSMIRGLMIRRSHLSLSNLVLGELRET
jgi:hypothetical protein